MPIVVSECNHAEDERGREESIQSRIEDIPEADIVTTDLPEFGYLVAHKTEGEDVEEPFDNVEIACGIYGVDRAGVKSQVDDRHGDLDGVLVHGHTKPIGIEMRPVIRVRFILVADEA